MVLGLNWVLLGFVHPRGLMICRYFGFDLGLHWRSFLAHGLGWGGVAVDLVMLLACVGWVVAGFGRLAGLFAADCGLGLGG